MFNVSCNVKNYVKDGINVIVRTAQRQKDRDYYIEIEVGGKTCLVDVADIHDAIDKCCSRLGRRGGAYRGYAPVRDNPYYEESDEE